MVSKQTEPYASEVSGSHSINGFCFSSRFLSFHNSFSHLRTNPYCPEKCGSNSNSYSKSKPKPQNCFSHLRRNTYCPEQCGSKSKSKLKPRPKPKPNSKPTCFCASQENKDQVPPKGNLNPANLCWVLLFLHFLWVLGAVPFISQVVTGSQDPSLTKNCVRLWFY